MCRPRYCPTSLHPSLSTLPLVPQTEMEELKTAASVWVILEMKRADALAATVWG